MGKYTCAQCHNARLDESDRNCWRCGCVRLVSVPEPAEETAFTFADDPALDKMIAELAKAVKDDGSKF